MKLRKFWFGETVVLCYSDFKISLEAIDFDYGLEIILYEKVVDLEDPTHLINSGIRLLEKLEGKVTLYEAVKLLAKHIDRQLERSWF